MQWMIYGANGYTGELIAREAVRRGLQPVLAGRSAAKLQPLARELGLELRAFGLDQAPALSSGLAGIGLVLHCAGPFSATSAPMIEACIAAGAHYLDISGEIGVFEHTHAAAQAGRARERGVVLCSGVGFDVIPTDCVALKLKQLLPDATALSLGFDSSSGPSTGTAKTVVESLGEGCLVRSNGRIVAVPMGSRARRIDFGRGARSAMAIPWGDVSTAYYSTGIASIDTWIPLPKPLVWGARCMNLLRPLLGAAPVQRWLKQLVERYVKGPDATARAQLPTYVWGEARNAAGTVRSLRIRTANIYDLTVDGAMAMVLQLLLRRGEGGSYTPAMLCGPELIEQLSGSENFQIG